MTQTDSIREALILDPGKEVERISGRLTELLRSMRRKGLVVAISGGIDSSVTLALAVKALGRDRVIALQMPEKAFGRRNAGPQRQTRRQVRGRTAARGYFRDRWKLSVSTSVMTKRSVPLSPTTGTAGSPRS